jgi:hypothetical protein
MFQFTGINNIIYKLSLPTLFCGCETWTIRGRDEYRMTSAEMNFFEEKTKYAWVDYKTNGQRQTD